MNFPWIFFIDIGIISAALLAATFIRARVPFFQKYLIPNALTAGFFLLFFYNYLSPLFGITSEGLGALVYHLLSISFIAMTLRRSPESARTINRKKSIFSMSIAILSQYAIQAVLGLGLTILLISTSIPDLFPSFGFFIPLGFALGPGQAYAIGFGWESFGFEGAGSIGLTFAAFGFLWACFGGIFLINHGIRKGWISPEQLGMINTKEVKTGIYPEERQLPVGSRLTTETEAIDSMSFNIAMVLVVYLATYLFLSLITFLLSFLGKMGSDLAVNLWGIGFVFAALLSLLTKKILKTLKIHHILDNGSLTRISGTAVDVMVAASIGAISLVIVTRYWFPIFLMSIMAGLITIVTVPWICSRIFTDHRFQRTLIIYGASTGTMPTGLALLRVIDPDFETPAASDYMYATGITFVLAIPLILIINLPVYSYTTGNQIYIWIAAAVCLGYLIFVFIAHGLLSRRKAYKKPGTIWLKEESRKAG
ncbi:MAG TPA: sodium:glutamate symporter [Spirochaetia bacterium]|nr:sodium:glutamate symporter [Spirochaetia bacterium]